MIRNLIFPLLFCFTLTAYQPPLILLTGAPGSGKGTIGAKISEKLQLPHISTGNLFRENLKNEGRLGELTRSCQAYMEQGLLIPDSIILDILKERISQGDCEKGYILEGYPRTLDQAQTFAEQLAKNHKVHIIELDVSEELLIDRLTGRLICTECQQTYHRSLSPPKTAGFCDKCGSSLSQRPDDRKEVVKKRLASYYEKQQLVSTYLQSQFSVTTLSCDNDVEKNLKNALQTIPYFSRDYLKKHLNCFPFKGIEKFYDVVAIYKDPLLMRFLTDTFTEESLACQADYIAGPEARSLPLLGAVANKAQKPALFIRKAGKIPGPIYSVTYSTGYSKETLELGFDDSLAGKKVVIIDDGIANGETMLSAISILEQAGMEVVGCFVVIEHHYVQRCEKYKKWEPLTLTLFDM